MNLIQSNKRMARMNSIAQTINAMLPETEAVIEIENPFAPHNELMICHMTGLEILLEENGFTPVTLVETTPTYAVFARPDGSRLGRNLAFCTDIWLQ